jgi:hypothetical protein
MQVQKKDLIICVLYSHGSYLVMELADATAVAEDAAEDISKKSVSFI